MLRKALWSGVLAGVSAVATLAATRLAGVVWRVATREEPPQKR